MIHERDRMAQRADKWWRSVWHKQMCMTPHGLHETSKPLTDGPRMGSLIGPEQGLVSDGPTVGKGE
jgi:hypothetical protein